MAGLAETLTSLGRYGRGMDALMGDGSGADAAGLIEEAEFGADPGNLGMLAHVPEGVAAGAPLVVVLHGCGQSAAGYARGAGWLELADRFGFVVVAPEQRRRNNAGGCFNWFVPEDVARGSGEAGSVRAMVAHAVAKWSLDRRRVFVTGLSAGGAFANALLATYPDVFAAGAIVAGLPYGAAHDTREALDMMRHGRQRPERDWGDLVRGASGHAGAWPLVSVWQGMADSTVSPGNGTELVRQWLNVHGLDYAGATGSREGPADHRTWLGADGRVAVELYTLPRLGHAVPISAADPDPDRRCGTAAPFIVETGVSSSYVIARSWGIAGPGMARRVGMRGQAGVPAGAPAGAQAARPAPAAAIASVIHKALKVAGLTG